MGQDGENGGGKASKKSLTAIIGSTIGVIVLLVLIALVALVFFVRTETGKEMVKERLEKAWGIPLTLQSARIAWPYTLVVEGLETKDFEKSNMSGIRIQEISIMPGVKARWDVRVFRAQLKLMMKKEAWMPEFFSRIGDLHAGGIAGIAKVTEEFRTLAAIDAKDCSVRWLDGDGNELCSANNIAFVVKPVAINGKTLYYNSLMVYSMTGDDGSSCKDMKREWFSTDRKGYVEIDSTGDAGSGFVKEFWEKK